MLQVHEFITGDFTFCSPSPSRNNNIDCSEEIEVGPLAERIESCYGCLGRDFNLVALTGENYGTQVEDEIRCPRLRKNASPTIIQAHSMHDEQDGRHICHKSRAQEIAKFHKEMMDMIQDVPEFAWELSLRDLVELPCVARAGQESPAEAKEEQKRKRGKRRISGCENIENRSFLLKMFFPFPTVGSKASPKPKFKDDQKDGLDTNESGKSSRSSSTSSTCSTSISRRKKRGCYPFL